MNDASKTKEQLLRELSDLRQTVTELISIGIKNEERYRHSQQLEKQLATEQKRLFSILDGLPALVYLIAPDYSIRFFNGFYQERFDKPNGQPCYKIFHGRTTPCQYCKSFKNGEAIKSLLCHRRYSNGYTYETYNYPYKDIDGSNMVLCFGIDITDRIQAEMALKLSEELLFKTFSTSPVSMSITTLADGRFININDSFRRFIGLKHDDIIGRTALEINLWVNPSERQLVKRNLIECGFVRDMEVSLRKITGEPRIGLYCAERIDVDGEECILSTYMDITEQRQIEMEMLRLDRLNLVGEMAASIGHEIRNPMTSVRGFLQMFQERYSEDKEFLDLMIEELDRANAIITEFLSLAKNKMVELKPENLNLIIQSILPLVQASASNQDKKIIFEAEQLSELLLDEKEIRQLILNLVYNGMESMSAGGTMTIKTFMEGGNVVLSIEDQGHGIEPDVLAKLGTPFFTTKDQGTGLGLAVCYGIAKRHNAKIRIDTSSNGSTFFVWFPRL